MRPLPRHGAALALVGWYLLIPAVDKTSRVRADLPLDYWVHLDSFDTAAECREQALQNQVRIERQTGNPESRVAAYVAWRCIASDDPRLKESK
jgi:hypothetical protein